MTTQVQAVMIALAALIAVPAQSANAPTAQALAQQTFSTALQQSQAEFSILGINWKVGDEMNYDVALGMFGKVGTMHNAVTKDEGEALWILNEINLSSQVEKIEALINKADGKVLKLLRNGKEEPIP